MRAMSGGDQSGLTQALRADFQASFTFCIILILK
jgi:hypothetical protein